jgi:photosystem II stability/assembly factor-like uncharacterized protein
MKAHIILLLLLFSGFCAEAQRYRQIIEANPDLTFKEIVSRVEREYQGEYKGRGSGYKQFKRWEEFNRTRLGRDGKLVNLPLKLLENFSTYNNNYLPPANLNFDCAWRQEGGNAYQIAASGHNGGLGRVNCLAVDPADATTIYAGTPAGGLWRTINAGGAWSPGTTTDNWTPLTDGLPSIGVSGIAIDYTSPLASRVLYILTGDGDGGNTSSIGVLKSFDHGTTWALTGLNLNNFTIGNGFKLLIHPTDPNTLFAATEQGIFKTTDGGVHWTQPFTSERITDIEFKPGDPTTMYAVSSTTFYRSTNTGDNWATVSWSVPSCQPTSVGVRLAMAVTPADANYIYIVASGRAPGSGSTFRGLFRSTDGGNCFESRSTTPNILGYATDGLDTVQQPFYDLTIAVSNTNRDEVHVGGIQCWRSLDGGSIWTNTTSWFEPSAGAGNYNHADLHAMEYVNGILYSGSDGGIYRTSNQADDWVNISQGLKITQYYRITAFTDDKVEYVAGGTQDNGSNILTNAGSGFGVINHWEGGDGFECSVDTVNHFVYGDANSNVNRLNYQTNAFTDINYPGTSFFPRHLYDDVNTALLVADVDIWRSTDNGGTFTNFSNGNIGLGQCSFIALAPSNHNVVYVSKGTILYRTTDSGATWSDISTTLPNNEISSFTVDPANQNRVWVCMGGFNNAINKVFFSPDGGNTWQNITGNLPNIPANSIIYESGSADGLYLGMDVGVYYRDNNLGDWLLFSNGLPNVIVGKMEINYNSRRLYAGTYGRGLWSSELFSDCARVCLQCPTFDEIHSQRNIYASETCINSESWVYQNTPVSYKAETYIRLTNGFYVDAPNGASFYGHIGNCVTGQKLDRLFQLTNNRHLAGYFVGNLPDMTDRNAETTERTLFRAYPNPTAGAISVEFEAPKPGPVSLELFDIYGKKVRDLEFNTVLHTGALVQSYSIGDLPNGTYVLRLRQEDTKYFQMLIKTGD